MADVAKVDHHAGMCALRKVTRLIRYSTHYWLFMIQVGLSDHRFSDADLSCSPWTGLPVVPGLVGQPS